MRQDLHSRINFIQSPMKIESEKSESDSSSIGEGSKSKQEREREKASRNERDAKGNEPGGNCHRKFQDVLILFLHIYNIRETTRSSLLKTAKAAAACRAPICGRTYGEKIT